MNNKCRWTCKFHITMFWLNYTEASWYKKMIKFNENIDKSASILRHSKNNIKKNVTVVLKVAALSESREWKKNKFKKKKG